MDQKFPPCDLGGVDRYDTAREPEICGTLSLMNGSPIGAAGDDGKWQITVQAPDNGKGDKLALDDFQLHIMAVGQPA